MTRLAPAPGPHPEAGIAAASAGSLPGTSVDFDLHGIVGIRLLDSTPADVAAVTAQLGPIQAPLARAPDIVIRFVDRLETGSPMYLVGAADAGYAGSSFFVLRGRQRASVRVDIPFDAIGRGCEIRSERGAGAVPHLIAIVNLCAAANGALPLHASAFRYRGRGVLVTGWARGGKTETLLAFLANGAEYVGDEWIYLTDDGSRMCGIPEPIRVWDWHLHELPGIRRQLGVLRRMRLGILRNLAAACALASGQRHRRHGRWQRPLARLGDLVARQCYAHLTPRAAFGEAFGSLRAPVEHVVFVESWDAPQIATTPVAGTHLAARIAFSLQEERSTFLSCYRKFRFAMPDRSNPLIEGIDELEAERLHRMFGNRICHAVHHPYPVSIPALFHAVHPLLDAGGP